MAIKLQEAETDIVVTGDDQIIIGCVDLYRLLKRVEEKVEHLWWIPGGPECQAAELKHEKNFI
jgi:hypothetical protein